MFVTSIVGEYNLITDEIRWVNAGHQPAILRNGQGEYDQFESSAPPLGVIKQKDKSVYNIHKTKLNGSRFYAFTDGLSESYFGSGAGVVLNIDLSKIIKIGGQSIIKEFIIGKQTYDHGSGFIAGYNLNLLMGRLPFSISISSRFNTINLCRIFCLII